MIWNFLKALSKTQSIGAAPHSAPSAATGTVKAEQTGISMSILTTLEGDVSKAATKVHNFVVWSEKELGILSVEAPTIAKEVDAAVTYIGGAASILAGLEGGPAASAAVTAFVDATHVGITAISGLVTDFGKNPTVATMASALASNAPALLAAAKITNPASVEAANKVISNLTSLATKLAVGATIATALLPATVSLA